MGMAITELLTACPIVMEGYIHPSRRAGGRDHRVRRIWSILRLEQWVFLVVSLIGPGRDANEQLLRVRAGRCCLKSLADKFTLHPKDVVMQKKGYRGIGGKELRGVMLENVRRVPDNTALGHCNSPMAVHHLAILSEHLTNRYFLKRHLSAAKMRATLAVLPLQHRPINQSPSNGAETLRCGTARSLPVEKADAPYCLAIQVHRQPYT